MLGKVAGARTADCSWFATRWICVVVEERNTAIGLSLLLAVMGRYNNDD